MRIQRTIPPAAAPIYARDVLNCLTDILVGRRRNDATEAEIKEYFNVGYVFTVSSGKAALTVILRALASLSPRKEVLIPAYTCFSVPSAIEKAGLKVALCDIEPSSLDFDYGALRKAINDDTLCVIPTHLLGYPSDMDRVNSICRERGVFVLEDAAQSMGGEYKGKMLGTIGDVGFFSLGRGKNITCGSGGIIMTNSGRIAEAIAGHYSKLSYPDIKTNLLELSKYLLMALFIRPLFYWFPSGLSFLNLGRTVFYRDFPVERLSSAKSGLMRGWRRRLERSNGVRRNNAAYFIERLRLSSDPDIACLRLPLLAEGREARDNILSNSGERGLGISGMYPAPINEIEELKGKFEGQEYPSARRVAETLLTVPTHHLLTERDRKRIVRFIGAALNKGASAQFEDATLSRNRDHGMCVSRNVSSHHH